MKSTPAPTSALTAHHRRRAEMIVKAAKWPAIGVLIGGGALLVGHLVGPSIARNLGRRAGEGLAEGWAETQERLASIARQFSISGWGMYR